MFVALTSENTAHVGLSNPYTGHEEIWDTLNDPKAIAYAVFCFARGQGLQPAEVRTSIVFPTETVPPKEA